MKHSISKNRGSVKHEPGNDMECSFSSCSPSSNIFDVASPYFPASPTSIRTPGTSNSCLSSPSRSTSALRYETHCIAMDMTPPRPPTCTAEDYVHVPSPINEDYVHVSPNIAQDYVHVSLPSNCGPHQCPQYSTTPSPAPTYFALHQNFLELPIHSSYMTTNHGSHFRDTESPQPMPVWSYGGPNPVFNNPPPMSMGIQNSILPSPSPIISSQVRKSMRRAANGGQGDSWKVQRTSGRGNKRPKRMATTADGIECEIIAPNKYICHVEGCGLGYARPEHLKRHQKKHDENPQVYTCKICLMVRPEKVHMVENRLDNFINHVKNHVEDETKDRSNSRTPSHPYAFPYLKSLQAMQKNRGRTQKTRASKF